MKKEKQRQAVPGPRFLRPEEAADYLGLASGTLANLRSTRRGPRFAKFGRAVRYDVQDLDAWAQAQLHVTESK